MSQILDWISDNRSKFVSLIFAFINLILGFWGLGNSGIFNMFIYDVIILSFIWIIEQKNYTHVRQKLGYRRFENQKIVELLNVLYKNEWRLYHNFFLPSVKLIEKERIRSKVIKKHDKPKTPYQRVLEADLMDVPHSVKQKLTKQLEYLNPFTLKKIIDKKIEKILQLAS